MLRLFAFLLLLANGLFFAWSTGYLGSWGFASTAKNESFRIKEQIEPERIVVIKQKDAAAIPAVSNVATTTNVTTITPAIQTASTVTAAPATPATPAAPAIPVVAAIPATPAAPAIPVVAAIPATPATPAIPVVAAATVCLNAGAFNDKQSFVLKQALNTKLPEVSWRFDTVTVPSRWIVYMGKYPNNATRDLKKSQLNQLKVRYEVLAEGKLEPGLSLGSHATQAAANQSLQQLFRQGVRTARVLQESPEQKGQTLVVPAIDDSNRAKLNTVYATLATQLGNKALQICK